MAAAGTVRPTVNSGTLEKMETGARPWLKAYPQGVRWDVSFPEEPITRTLEASVERYPDRPCLDFLDKRYTYREVGASSTVPGMEPALWLK